MELNNIKSSKINWGDAANDLNQNFGKINNAIEQVKNATTRNKGYFSSDTALKAAFEKASVGDIAYVGNAYPYQIWKWNGSAWANSGSTGGEESVRLGDYHTAEYVDEKLSELGSKTIKNIGDSSYIVYSFQNFEQGTLSGSGEAIAATSRWRSKEMVALPILNGKPMVLRVEKSDDIMLYIYWYDKNGSFISHSNIITSSSYSTTPPTSAVYCKILVAPTIEVSHFTQNALYVASLLIRANEVDSIDMLQQIKENAIKISTNTSDTQITINETIGVKVETEGMGISTSGKIQLWEASCIFNKVKLKKGDSVQVTTLTWACCVIAKPTYDTTTPYLPLVNAVDSLPSSSQTYLYTAEEDIEIVCSGSTADTKVLVLSPNSLIEKISAHSDDIHIINERIEGIGNIFSIGWNIGVYYESIINNTSRRYKVVKVNIGERYRITNLSAEWGGFIYFADNNGTIDYLSIENNMEIFVGVRNGRIPTEMRITIFHFPEKVLTDVVWVGFNAKMYNLSKSPLCKPIVAEWNFGMLNNGVSPMRIEDGKVDEVLPKIKSLIVSLGADILYTTEYVKELDRSQKRNTYEEVLKQFYPYHYYGGNMMAIFSKHPFFVQSTTTPDGRNCELGFININGNVIGFGEIHPRSASGTEAENARIADHQMIIDYFADYDRVIIGGDFNNYEDRELDVYRNAGWNLGNCGYFGNIDTYKPDSRPWYIDNIVTKGINIDNFVKVDNRADISDHYPVVANLSFL